MITISGQKRQKATNPIGEADYDLKGLSTDVKPTEGVAVNSLFLEVDTGKFYFYAGNNNWEVAPSGGGGGGGGGTTNYNELSNKPKINNVELAGNRSLSDLGIDIPTKTSELTNDSVFVTEDEVIQELDNYYTKGEADGLLDGKVDKISGKGLSTNDFTNADKTQITSNKDDISSIEDGTADIEFTITDAEITTIFNEVFGDLLPGKVDLDTVLTKGNTSDKNIILSGDGSTNLTVESPYSTTEIESGSVRLTASDGTSNGLDASVGGLGIYSESGDISGSAYFSGVHTNMSVYDSQANSVVGMFSMDVEAHYLDMDDDLKSAWQNKLGITESQNAINLIALSSTKNILPNVSKNAESNGITYTLNSDGSITANGTATDLSQYLIKSNYNLPVGKYILSGCPAGGASESYSLKVRNDTVSYGLSDYGEGCEITVTNPTDSYRFRIIIAAGATVNNLTFYPMLRAAGITDGTYTPYCKNNSELTSDVSKCIEKNDTGWEVLNPQVMYRKKDNLGWVYLGDSIGTSLTSAWTVIGTLPEGYGADGTYYFAVPINNTYGNLKIASNREISLNSPSGANSGAPLRGLVSFPLLDV